MKLKGGTFKQKSEPTVIGANMDEPDTADLLENMKNRQNEEVEGGDDDDSNPALTGPAGGYAAPRKRLRDQEGSGVGGAGGTREGRG